MNYINKAVKNFANRLSNEFGFDVKIDKEEKDPVVYLSLERGDNEICISIHHFTKKYQNTLFVTNSRHYYTPWGELSDEVKNDIRIARRLKMPVINISGGFYNNGWCVREFNTIVLGIRGFVGDELYNIIRDKIVE